MSDNFDGNEIFPKSSKNEAYAQYFQGTSHLNMLSTEGATIGNVVFELGCRNNWHIHLRQVMWTLLFVIYRLKPLI